jgi:hypothetical protein
MQRLSVICLESGHLPSCLVTVNGNDNCTVEMFTFVRKADVQMHLRIYIHRSLLLEFSYATGANKFLTELINGSDVTLHRPVLFNSISYVVNKLQRHYARVDSINTAYRPVFRDIRTFMT